MQAVARHAFTTSILSREQRVERAGEEAGGTERGVPVRGRLAEHRAGRRDDIAGDGRDPEEDAAEEVDSRLPPAGAGTDRQPAAPTAALRGAVGDRARDEEADRATPVGSPDEPVVLRARQRRVQCLIGRNVEEERARGLDDRRPPVRAPPGGASVAPGEPTLDRAAQGEQDRADEERDGVGRVADELGIARKRADQEAGRPHRETEAHPPPATHDVPPFGGFT